MKSPLQITLVVAISLLVTTTAVGLGASRLWATDKNVEAPASHRPQLVPLSEAGTDASEALYPTWWGSPPNVPEGVPCKDSGNCVTCHEKTSRMDPKHAVACIQCHAGDSKAGDKEAAHVGLIKDPGDLKTVNKTCAGCHPEESRKVKHSAMALAPRMINHTRFAFGGQNSPDFKYATIDLIVPLKRGNQPEAPRRGKEVPSHEPLKGNMPGTLRPEPCPRNDDGSRGSRIHEMRNRVRVMCEPGSVGGLGGRPPRPTRPEKAMASPIEAERATHFLATGKRGRPISP